jgi:hypothetical protein
LSKFLFSSFNFIKLCSASNNNFLFFADKKSSYASFLSLLSSVIQKISSTFNKLSQVIFTILVNNAFSLISILSKASFFQFINKAKLSSKLVKVSCNASICFHKSSFDKSPDFLVNSIFFSNNLICCFVSFI